MTSSSLPFDGVPPDRDIRYKNAQCAIRIVRPVPHIIISQVDGYFTADAVAAFDATFRRLASDGVHYSVFHDWWDINDYVPEARTKLTTLGRDQESVTDNIHILFRSKVVAFGVRIASFVLPNINSYSDRDVFEKLLRDALSSGAPASRRK